MSTYSLTSTQIIKTLSGEGLVVTEAQLGRWSRTGLLGERIREGRGRGRGVDWFWSDDTRDRARIIAKTLEGRGATLADAAEALLLSNYPVSPFAMRVGLLNILRGAQDDLRLRQPYLEEEIPDAEKQQRMRRSLRKRFRQFNSFFVKFSAALGTWMFCNPDQPFSFVGIRRALRTLTDDDLQEITDRVQADLPQMRTWPGNVTGDPLASIDGLWAYVRSRAQNPELWPAEPPLLVAGVVALAITKVHGHDWLLPLLRRIAPQSAAYIDAELEETLESVGSGRAA